MYSGGFYPYETLEEYWAWWSRNIYVNRYTAEVGRPYTDLLSIVKGKEYFVLTTNVDHRFQLAGFDKMRLFYTQGDYGLWQCSKPCHQATYDNELQIRMMMDQQEDMRIPTKLIPRCPICGAPMTMNLRCDDSFVQDAGWYAAANRYKTFLQKYQTSRILFLELGVGSNTCLLDTSNVIAEQSQQVLPYQHLSVASFACSYTDSRDHQLFAYESCKLCGNAFHYYLSLIHI